MYFGIKVRWGSAKNYGKRRGSNKSKHNKCFNNIVNLCINFPYTFICLHIILN